LDNIESLLIYDNYPRISLLDHYFTNETSLEDYSRVLYHPDADLSGKIYNLKNMVSREDNINIELELSTVIPCLSKTISISLDSVMVFNYHFYNNGMDYISRVFGCEFNINLYSDQDMSKYYYLPESDRRREIHETGEEKDIMVFSLINKTDGLLVRYEFSLPVTVWFYPIMTVSKSEEGFEHTYQGSSILFRLPLDLPPAGKKGVEIRMSIEDCSNI
jgi:alpha-amylase